MSVKATFVEAVHTRRWRAVALAGVMFLLAASASWASGGGVPRSATQWRSIVVKGDHQWVQIGPISCASRGNCTAVGSYGGEFGDPVEGLLLTEKAGHWGIGVMPVLPANAASDPEVSLTSVSCASAGNCTAVGFYSPGGQGLLLTEKNGQWAAGVEAVLPANAASSPAVSLDSVSCASPGNCTAVGNYDSDGGGIYDEGGQAGLLLTEKAGHWAAGVEAVLPADVGYAGYVYLHSVSCASAGNCTAVGNADNVSALLLTEKAGHWARAVDPIVFAYGEADIYSVSCSSPGSCSAVGYYDYSYSGGRDGVYTGYPLLLSKKRGKWRLVDVRFPPDGPGESAVLNSVSCASDGSCSAVGSYNEGIDQEGAPEGMLLTEKAGKWGRGVKAKPPRDASSGYYGDYVDLSNISCGSPGNCTAVGSYYVHDRVPRGVLLTEIAGRWARGVKAPHWTDSVLSVSCSTPGACGAVEEAGIHAVLLDRTCVVPKLEGKTVPGARHSIESHNCSAGTIVHAASFAIPTGHVISQIPRPGLHVVPGTKIDLTISSGP